MGKPIIMQFLEMGIQRGKYKELRTDISGTPISETDASESGSHLLVKSSRALLQKGKLISQVPKCFGNRL